MSVGGDNDYSQNPRTQVPFPFSYGDTLTDTWQEYGGSEEDVLLTYDGYGTLITPAGTYQNVVRVKESYSDGEDYFWYTLNPFMSILVYDHNQNFLIHVNATPTGIENEESPYTFALAQNYPNPFNPSTNITFSIPSKSFVSLKVFDVIGNEVAAIISEEMDAGNYSTEWNAEGIPSGVYFYRLQAGAFSETKKLTLIR